MTHTSWSQSRYHTHQGVFQTKIFQNGYVRKHVRRELAGDCVVCVCVCVVKHVNSDKSTRAHYYMDAGVIPIYEVSTPANTRRRNSVVSMLGQRRRRWPNIEATLVQRLVFAGTGTDGQTVGSLKGNQWEGCAYTHILVNSGPDMYVWNRDSAGSWLGQHPRRWQSRCL